MQLTIVGNDPAQSIVRAAHIVSAFGEIGGGLGLVVDSYGMLAICKDRASAAIELDASVGMGVVLAPTTAGGVTANVRLSRKTDQGANS